MGVVRTLFGILIGLTFLIIILNGLIILLPDLFGDVLITVNYFTNFFLFMFLIIGVIIGVASIGSHISKHPKLFKFLKAVLSFDFIRAYDIVTNKIVFYKPKFLDSNVREDYFDYGYVDEYDYY